MENKEFIEFLDSHWSASQGVNIFYHYTSLETFINGIVVSNPQEGKEIRLRVTHSEYLNDPTELKIGIDLLSRMIETIQNEKPNDESIKKVSSSLEELKIACKNSYLISFSCNVDSLPMWTTYARNGEGIAIGFKRIKSMTKQDVILKCLYGDEMNTLLSVDYSNLLNAVALAYLPYIIKSQYYSYEEEVRLIGKFNDAPIKFREKKGLVVPFKELYFPKEQIECIKIGPSANQSNVEKSLRFFLDGNNMKDVRIEKSDIPYRSF